MVLADLAQGVMECAPQSSGMVGIEVHDDAGTGLAEFLDGEHDARLGVVVVIADGHRPGGRGGVIGAGGKICCGERLIVDGTTHLRSPHR
jgi:hypothetical protein